MATKFRLRVINSFAQGLSGAIAYYSCEALSDYFVFREGASRPVARFFFLFFFPCSAIVTFVLLTVAWYRWLAREHRTQYAEVSIIIGTIILMPVYFELASHLIYNPTPIVVSEFAENVAWLYALFPLTVIEVGTYTLSLHCFALAATSAVVTGYLLRRSVRRAVV